MNSVGEAVADIGHVHLKVADLDRAVGFYRDVLGMEVKNAVGGAVFLAFGYSTITSPSDTMAKQEWRSVRSTGHRPGPRLARPVSAR